MITRSRNHLRRNRMTYTGHMRFASLHGALCIRAGLMLLVHSVVPGVWETAGGLLLGRLQQSFTAIHAAAKDQR